MFAVKKKELLEFVMCDGKCSCRICFIFVLKVAYLLGSFFVCKFIMGVKEKPDIMDIIERKRLQWYGHVKRMRDERLPKLIMEWIPGKRRKRGRPRKTWMEGVRAAMKTRHLEADQCLNRKEWCLGSRRRR